MRNEIINIAEDLKQGTIDLNTARTRLLGLFGVRDSLLIKMVKKHIASEVGFEMRKNGDKKYRQYGASDDWIINEVVKYVLSNSR